MKKIKFLVLIPLLLTSLSGCKQEIHKEYDEAFFYDDPIYEPLEIAHSDPNIFVLSTELLNVYKGVKAAAWDDSEVKIRVKYSDYSIKDFDLKTKNFPLEMRHYLGEIGTHRINLIEYKWIVGMEFEIIENPDWHGYTCEFFDKDKKFLHKEIVGYYQDVNYNGPEIPTEQDDYNYQYVFKGWDHSTKYIHQDTQFLGIYEKVEKRYYANMPYNTDHVGLSNFVDSNNKIGNGLVYLGRVRRVPTFYSESQFLCANDIYFEPQFDEYGKYFNEYNENIVKYCLQYEENGHYISNVYGNPYELLNNPSFALDFDKRYEYYSVKAFLDDKSEVSLSSRDPYDNVFDDIYRCMKTRSSMTVTKAGNQMGYYRYAVVSSFDVYLSASFERIENHVYQISNFNEFIMAPVKDTAEVVIQFCEDDKFEQTFDSKLVISTEGLYYAAEMVDWNN